MTMLDRMGYPGGKAKTFHHILNIVPPHTVYLEPFLGHGSVLRAKRRSPIEIVVDLDRSVLRCDQLLERGVATVCGDGIAFLRSYPFEGHEVVYCDPPYLPETRRRTRVYRHDACVDDHVRLLETIRTLNAHVIISGYQSELYRDALSDWNWHRFPSKAHDGVREEWLWFNYDPPSELHDYRYLGSTFRQRQSIKRRIERLKDRIDRLSPQERAYIQQWLVQGGNEHAD